MRPSTANIIAVINSAPGVQTQYIAERFGASTREMSARLQRLAHKGLVVRRGAGWAINTGYTRNT